MGIYVTTVYIRMHHEGTPYINHVSKVKHLRNAQQPSVMFRESDVNIDHLNSQSFQELLNKLQQQCFPMAADSEETIKNRLHNDGNGCHRLCIWSGEGSGDDLRRYYDECDAMFKANSSRTARPNVPDLIQPLRQWAGRYRRHLLGEEFNVFVAPPPEFFPPQQRSRPWESDRSWRTAEPSIERQENQRTPTIAEPAPFHYVAVRGARLEAPVRPDILPPPNDHRRASVGLATRRSTHDSGIQLSTAPRRNIFHNETELRLAPRPSMANRGTRVPPIQLRISPALPTNEATTLRRHNTGDSGIEIRLSPRHTELYPSTPGRTGNQRPQTMVEPTPRQTERSSRSALERTENQCAPTVFVPTRCPGVRDRARLELNLKVQGAMEEYFHERLHRETWQGLKALWSEGWVRPTREQCAVAGAEAAKRGMAADEDIARRLEGMWGVRNGLIRDPPMPDPKLYLEELGMRC